MRSILQLSIFFLLISNCFPLRAIAQSNAFTSAQKVSSAEGVAPIKDQLIVDFLAAAFSNSLWLSNTGNPTDELLPFKAFVSHLADQHSVPNNWVGDFAHRSHGLPLQGTIVKWNKPVSVAIGWPQFGSDGGYMPDADLLAFVSEKARIAIRDIEQATPFPITFMQPTDPREKTADFAKIRIVLSPDTGIRNHFKFLNYSQHLSSEDWFYQLNTAYVGAVPFTPSAGAQVDGFLIPNPDNSIGLAVCRISSRLPREQIAALVDECLVRSMGLTEAVPGLSVGVLSAWNHDLERSEKTPLKDGAAASIWPLASETEKQNFYALVPKPSKPVAISRIDKQLIQLLYCSELPLGSDKYQAALTLLKTKTCFNKINF